MKKTPDVILTFTFPGAILTNMRDIDTEDAGGYSRAAAIDAQERNRMFAKNFTPLEHVMADNVLAQMATAGINATRYFKNCRETFLAVKAKFDREIYMHDAKVAAFTRSMEAQGHKVKRALRSKSLIVQLKRI